jgi:hypothetical protein
MKQALRYGLIVAALSAWVCLGTKWQPSAVLSAVLTVGALLFALVSMAGSGRALITALFWLYFGGTYVSSSVEAYAFGLRTLSQSVFSLAGAALVSALVSLGLVWASGRFHEPEPSVIPRQWRWRPAIGAAFVFCFVYLLAGALVLPKVGAFYTNLPVPPLPALLGLQLARGLVWVAILFPCLRRIESRGRAIAVMAVGAVTLGALAPLAAPNDLMPLNIRLWHMVEMTGSHAIFGVFTAWVFVRARPLDSRTASDTAQPAIS